MISWIIETIRHPTDAIADTVPAVMIGLRVVSERAILIYPSLSGVTSYGYVVDEYTVVRDM